jgi:hypothetical protein
MDLIYFLGFILLSAFISNLKVFSKNAGHTSDFQPSWHTRTHMRHYGAHRTNTTWVRGHLNKRRNY